MLNHILNIILILIGAKTPYRDSVDEGVIDLSGQGRDRYGK